MNRFVGPHSSLKPLNRIKKLTSDENDAFSDDTSKAYALSMQGLQSYVLKLEIFTLPQQCLTIDSTSGPT